MTTGELPFMHLGPGAAADAAPSVTGVRLRLAASAGQLERAESPRILVVPFAFDEGEKIRTTLSRFPRERNYHLLVMDDGSTDGSLDHVDTLFGASVLSHDRNRGVGAAMKT